MLFPACLLMHNYTKHCIFYTQLINPAVRRERCVCIFVKSIHDISAYAETLRENSADRKKFRQKLLTKRATHAIITDVRCRRSSMAARPLPKPDTRVRFPSPAPQTDSRNAAVGFCFLCPRTQSRSRTVGAGAVICCFYCFLSLRMERPILPFATSTEITRTSTISPTLTTSEGCFTLLSASCEIWTSPS